MQTDQEIRAGIKAQVAAVASDSARIITRWKLGVEPEEWGAVVRDKKDPNKINGCVITRRGIRSIPVTAVGHHYEYQYVYDLWYFLSVREGTEADNSELDLNTLLDNLIRRLHDNPTLGLPDNEGNDVVDAHGGLQVRDIDTMGNFHVAQCELTVRITYQT